jgi:flagellar M-ring protein FliF
VQIVNASFSSAGATDATPAEPWYANPLVKQLARQGIAVGLVLLLVLVVLRPIMKHLVASPARLPAMVADGRAPVGAGELERDRVTLSSGGASGGVAALPNYEQHVAVARNVATQDPKRAAQVVKEWVGADGR